MKWCGDIKIGNKQKNTLSYEIGSYFLKEPNYLKFALITISVRACLC